jgi:hypothetical protein
VSQRLLIILAFIGAAALLAKLHEAADALLCPSWCAGHMHTLDDD